jgi:UDP-N-acetylmuramoyl-L-alanyl-D-glutamate--2,6-diaminopimelate ligase
VCVDDEWGRELARTASIPVTTVASVPGVEAQWQVVGGERPEDLVLTDGATTLRLRSALPGDFNRVNTAMAALALMAVGFSAQDAERALLVDPHVPGRMERVSLGTDDPAAGLPLVVVDYAHTPDAVAAALRALRPTTRGSLVVVLGAGGDRDRGKRAAMGLAAAQHADLVFVTDDNPRSEDPAAIRAAVLEGARGAGATAELHEVAGRAAAIDAAVRAAVAAGPGATVAIVGKGHETGQDVRGTIHPFDDRDEARKALHSAATRGGPR